MDKFSSNSLRTIKILKSLELPVNLCFAVQNTWITALMISLHTPDIIDSFIWIIPNILSILLRPYLTMFALSDQKKARNTELSLIGSMMLVGITGCFLVGASIYLFGGKVMRIIVCTLGWTLMDFGFEMVQYFSERYCECMCKGEIRSSDREQESVLRLSMQRSAENNNWAFVGTLAGYAISIAFCYLFSDRSLQKFRNKSAEIYLISAFISLIFYMVFYLNTRNYHSSFMSKIKLFQPPYCSDIGYYMPGYYQFMMANVQDKLYLFYHFTMLFFVDTVLIYTTMWIIYCNESYGYKEGPSYNYGMLYGSFYLILYTLFYFLQLDFGKHDKKEMQKILLIGFSILFITSIACFCFFYEYLICILCILVGIVQSYYQNHFQKLFAEENPVYEVCLQFVDKVQKIFILCPMPFITMILLKRDDIEDCMVWMGALGIMCLIFAGGFRYSLKTKEKKKAVKINKVE